MQASALILEFEHLNVQRNVYAQAKYSAMFMHFTYPIIAVTQSEFEFSTKVGITSLLCVVPTKAFACFEFFHANSSMPLRNCDVLFICSKCFGLITASSKQGKKIFW